MNTLREDLFKAKLSEIDHKWIRLPTTIISTPISLIGCGITGGVMGMVDGWKYFAIKCWRGKQS